MSKHTPWKKEVLGGTIGRIDKWRIVGANRRAIAETLTDLDGDSEGIASLIAAAPDLLEAMKGILAITDRNHIAWEKARAAIAKAEGK